MARREGVPVGGDTPLSRSSLVLAHHVEDMVEEGVNDARVEQGVLGAFLEEEQDNVVAQVALAGQLLLLVLTQREVGRDVEHDGKILKGGEDRVPPSHVT